jgi:hypothetical protein
MSTPQKRPIFMPRLDLGKVEVKQGYAKPEPVTNMSPIVVMANVIPEPKLEQELPQKSALKLNLTRTENERVSATQETQFKAFTPPKKMSGELVMSPPSPRLVQIDFEDRKRQMNQKLYKTLSELDPYTAKALMGDSAASPKEVTPSTPRSYQVFMQKSDIRSKTRAASIIQRVWRGYTGRRTYSRQIDNLLDQQEQDIYEKEKNELERGSILTESEVIQEHLMEKENHHKYVSSERTKAAFVLQQSWREYVKRKQNSTTSSSDVSDDRYSETDTSRTDTSETDSCSHEWIPQLFAKYLTFEGGADDEPLLDLDEQVPYTINVRSFVRVK